MFFGFSKNNLSSTESVDIIEKMVYEYLKPLNFKKYGRTIHRFVDGDVSQVINFQNGCPQKGVYGILWINLGIRVPECFERRFTVSEVTKKYYHEYECNIRSRLGYIVNGKDTYYNLKNDPNKIAKDIIKRIEKYVIPAFNTLNGRDTILKYRRNFPRFDQVFPDGILLDEAMIMGRKGNIEEATQIFNKHYQDALTEYNHELKHGTKTYLKKGEKMLYYNNKTDNLETITATKNGYVVTYDASDSHLRYLEDLAKELGISINNPLT